MKRCQWDMGLPRTPLKAFLLQGISQGRQCFLLHLPTKLLEWFQWISQHCLTALLETQMSNAQVLFVVCWRGRYRTTLHWSVCRHQYKNSVIIPHRMKKFQQEAFSTEARNSKTKENTNNKWREQHLGGPHIAAQSWEQRFQHRAGETLQGRTHLCKH